MPAEVVIESGKAKGEPSSAVTPSRSQTSSPATKLDATIYVGSPAVGTSKAASAGGIAFVGPKDTELNHQRRRFVWSCVVAFVASWFIAFLRFFFPRVLFEPATVFKIGYPSDYGLGIDEKWLQKFRIWVDRNPDRLFVIYALYPSGLHA